MCIKSVVKYIVFFLHVIYESDPALHVLVLCCDLHALLRSGLLDAIGELLKSSAHVQLDEGANVLLRLVVALLIDSIRRMPLVGLALAWRLAQLLADLDEALTIPRAGKAIAVGLVALR